MMKKRRNEGVDQDHPHPLLPPPLNIMMIGVSTVPRGGGGAGHDPIPILPTVTVITAMIVPEENIPKNHPNDGAKVVKVVIKNGGDLPAKNGRANTKIVGVTVGKKRKRKRSPANEVIDRKGIDHYHLLNRHYILRIVVVGTMMMMTIQMFDDLPFQAKRSKCTLTNQQMIW